MEMVVKNSVSLIPSGLSQGEIMVLCLASLLELTEGILEFQIQGPIP